MPTLGQYTRPYVGQPFRMTHNSEKYIEGQVSGISVTGHTINHETGERIEDWTAVISSGIEGDGRIYARANMVDGGWLPIPEEECSKRYGVAYMRLREEMNERMDALTAALDVLVETKATVTETRATVTEAAADVVVDAEPPARRRRAG